MLPLSYFVNTLIQRNKVVFPLPDGPMIETTSPRFISILTPFNTSVSLKDLCKFFAGSHPIVKYFQFHTFNFF